MGVLCDYCHEAAVLVTGAELYTHRPDLAEKKFWQCKPCNAHVGCHKAGDWTYVGHNQVLSDGTLPFGRLANPELRIWKQRAHAALDQLWQGGGMSRRAAYQLASERLHLRMDQTHIGMFDVDQCKRLVEAFTEKQP